MAREQGALLACGERAFLSHMTAAAVLGLVPDPPSEVEVSVVGRYRASSKGIRVHRVETIDRRELRRHEGLWLSSPERALLEIAATRPMDLLADALNEGLARRIPVRREIEAVLSRHRGRRGAGRLAELIASGAGTAITRSEAERRFKHLIREARLPCPEVNVPFGRYEADFLWCEERLVVEIDGYTFHSGPKSFHSDHEKDLVFRDAGLDVLRFTRDHVVHQGTMTVARTAGALARLRAGDH